MLENAFGFGGGNGTIYAVWQENGTGRVQFAARTGSWSPPQTITTIGNNTNPVWTASYDPLREELYLLYYDYASNQIHQYSGKPGNWYQSLVFNVQEGNFLVFIGSDYNAGNINDSTSVLGLYWVQADNSQTNIQLMFSDEYIT